VVVKIMYEPVFHFQYPDLRGSMETLQICHCNKFAKSKIHTTGIR
jgi:hypothetical protein